MEQQKALSELTDKEWRGTIITLAFLGVFILFFGQIKIGLSMVGISVIGGSILHYVFGIKIIQVRNDLKHPKYKKK